MKTESDDGLPDFVDLHSRFIGLGLGYRAELRRVSTPDDLSLVPAFYRLFPGKRPDARHRRVAFLLPWCRHSTKPTDLGRQFVERHINERRLLQVARANAPIDLIQFRRLAMHVEPVVDWAQFGQRLWFWGPLSKRLIVEDFYLAQIT